jgi:hypothetical protein
MGFQNLLYRKWLHEAQEEGKTDARRGVMC